MLGDEVRKGTVIKHHVAGVREFCFDRRRLIKSRLFCRLRHRRNAGETPLHLGFNLGRHLVRAARGHHVLGLLFLLCLRHGFAVHREILQFGLRGKRRRYRRTKNRGFCCCLHTN